MNKEKKMFGKSKDVIIHFHRLFTSGVETSICGVWHIRQERSVRCLWENLHSSLSLGLYIAKRCGAAGDLQCLVMRQAQANSPKIPSEQSQPLLCLGLKKQYRSPNFCTSNTLRPVSYRTSSKFEEA